MNQSLDILAGKCGQKLIFQVKGFSKARFSVTNFPKICFSGRKDLENAKKY
jgi:hypothetical protein